MKNRTRFKKELAHKIDIIAEATKFLIFRMEEIRREIGLTLELKNNNKIVVTETPVNWDDEVDVERKNKKIIFKGSVQETLEFCLMEWKNGRTAPKPNKPKVQNNKKNIFKNNRKK